MENPPGTTPLGFRWRYWNTPTGRQIAKVLTKDGRRQLQGEREQRRLQRWRQRHPEEWARRLAMQRQRSNEMREEFIRGQAEQDGEEDMGARKRKKFLNLEKKLNVNQEINIKKNLNVNLIKNLRRNFRNNYIR